MTYHSNKEAGSRPSTRGLFGAVYDTDVVMTKVKDVDDKYVFSERFGVRRGVIQGDITSSYYFILALEVVLRRHDRVVGKGVGFGGE